MVQNENDTIFDPESMEFELSDLKFDTVVNLDSRQMQYDIRRLERDYETCKFDAKRGKFVGVKSSYRGPRRNKKHRLQQKLANAQQELEAVKEELTRTRAELERVRQEDEYDYCSCGGTLTWIEGADVNPDARYMRSHWFCAECGHGQSAR